MEIRDMVLLGGGRGKDENQHKPQRPGGSSCPVKYILGEFAMRGCSPLQLR